jgi:23S rRNA (adenine2503-C2)-methyltransferase
VNDSLDDAHRLVRLLKKIPSKINLIPFNAYSGCEYERPDERTIMQFQDILVDAGLTVLVRKSKGQDILAACGQLKAKYKA